MAQAWVASTRGESSRAVSLCQDACDAAATMGEPAVEALAYHLSLRLGAEPARVTARLRVLARAVEGDFAAMCLEHAIAAELGDGSRLDRVATRFEALGTTLSAADAAAHASIAHNRTGSRSRTVSSAARAQTLAQQCEDARTPALNSAARTFPLTRREREVSLLAANGAASRDIAGKLDVSVRTVDGHLARSYTKLGVTSRSGLAAMLQSHEPIE
jgi:DNA-binding CsgD family transcriptional regulator